MRSGTTVEALSRTAVPSPGLKMYFAILSDGIPDLVATRSLPARTPLVIRDDVVYGLIKVLETALLDGDGKNPWADVSSVVDPNAWAYSLLRSRAAFVLRDVMRERQLLSQANMEELGQVLVAPVPNPADSDSPLEALDEVPVEESLLGSTGLRRLHLQAAHMRAFLRVPEITTPFTRDQCDQLLALVVAAPHVAVDSLDRVCCGSDGASHPIDALWDNYSPAAALRLSYADPRSIQLLVTAALSPRSRPGRDVLLSHRKLLKQRSGRRGWPSLAQAVQEAWLSEFFSHTADKGIRRESQTSCLTWEMACGQAIEFLGSPLGDSPEEIDQLLCGLLEQAAEDSLPLFR